MQVLYLHESWWRSIESSPGRRHLLFPRIRSRNPLVVGAASWWSVPLHSRHGVSAALRQFGSYVHCTQRHGRTIESMLPRVEGRANPLPLLRSSGQASWKIPRFCGGACLHAGFIDLPRHTKPKLLLNYWASDLYPVTLYSLQENIWGKKSFIPLTPGHLHLFFLPPVDTVCNSIRSDEGPFIWGRPTENSISRSNGSAFRLVLEWLNSKIHVSIIHKLIVRRIFISVYEKEKVRI